MNELSSSSEDISYILKAHSLVKRAQDSEQLGFIEDAIEYHLQASNYFTLAIKQTNNDQTISALKVLSQNHLKKSNDLRNTRLINNYRNKNNNKNGGINNEDDSEDTPHLLIYNETQDNNNINNNMYNNNNNNNNNINNANLNIYNNSNSNPINIGSNVNNNSNNSNQSSYNSMTDSTSEFNLSQLSPNRLMNYMNDSFINSNSGGMNIINENSGFGIHDSVDDSTSAFHSNFYNGSGIHQGSYYIYPSGGSVGSNHMIKPPLRYHEPHISSSSLPANLSSSPHSTFWFGIEKLLDILPKPNVFGLQKQHQRNKSDDRSLMNSFFIVESKPNNNFNNNSINTNINNINNNNNNFNNNNKSPLNVIDEEEEGYQQRLNNIQPQPQYSPIQQQLKKQQEQPNSFDDDLASKLKQVEISLVNHTVEALLEENKSLKQENEFLKDRIMQFRVEIEKKTSSIRNSKDSTSQFNRLTQSISPSSAVDITQSTTSGLDIPKVTSASFYPTTTTTTTSTITTNTTPMTSSSTLTTSKTTRTPMEEIKYLREQLEEKDKTILEHKKRWDKLIESAKKKREFHSSTNSNPPSTSNSLLNSPNISSSMTN
ncbi:hypothetical protein ACTFIV_009172 [Dictyostelium citrinum]